jgi:hypothetical protein
MQPILGKLATGAALLGLLACGGGGTSAPPVTAPTQLALTGDEYKVVNASWTASPGTIEGYRFQGRFGGGDWGLDQFIPPYQTTWSWRLADNIPELTLCTYRIWALKGTQTSAFSNEATYRVGLAPASGRSQEAEGGVLVQWSNNSLVADTVVLEKGLAPDASTKPTVWARVPGVGIGVTEYLDQDLAEHQFQAYRVTYSKGADSAQASLAGVQVVLAPPQLVGLTPRVHGVSLAWANRSQASTDVLVYRAQGLDAVNGVNSVRPVATLPPTATSYEDDNLLPGGYTYWVGNRSGFNNSLSLPLSTQALPAPGEPSFTSSLVTLPLLEAGVLTRAGAWHLGQRRNPLTIVSPAAGGWTTLAPSGNAEGGGAFLQLDAQDRPHVVYVQDSASGSGVKNICHAWFDGLAWLTEIVAERPFYGVSREVQLTYALDAAGSPQIAWLTGTSSYAFDLEVAHKEANGAWQVEALHLPDRESNNLGAYQRMLLTLDGAGVPHVLVGQYGLLRQATRSSLGLWTWETILNQAYGLIPETVSAASSPDGGFHVFYELTDLLPQDSTKPTGLYRVDRVDGLWSAPQALFHLATGYLVRPPLLLRSGERLALNLGGKVLVHDAKGTSTTALGFGDTPILAFDAQDRLVALTQVKRVADASLYYALWQLRQFTEVP